MNALARIVRDLTSGREPSQGDLDVLNHQELTALRASVVLSPRETAHILAEAEPQQDWLSAPKAARQIAG